MSLWSVTSSFIYPVTSSGFAEVLLCVQNCERFGWREREKTQDMVLALERVRVRC